MRKGLAIGASRYSEDNEIPVAPIDAQRIAKVLRRNADDTMNIEFAVETDVANRISEQLLSARLDTLFSTPASLAVFYYSGHAQQHGDDCHLLIESDTGVFRIAVVDLVARANNSTIQDAVLIFDCCHSGVNANWSSLSLRPGVCLFAACGFHERAWTNERSSVFTELLLDGLEGASADSIGEITTSGLYSFIERPLGAWEQRPLFAANLHSTQVLRRCANTRTIEAIRLMPSYFPISRSVYQLDPAHFRTDLKADLAKVHAYSQLEVLFKEGMIDVDHQQSLFEAAGNASTCRLSRKGVAYWQLAKGGRI
jgi:hypothetical protein